MIQILILSTQSAMVSFSKWSILLRWSASETSMRRLSRRPYRVSQGFQSCLLTRPTTSTINKMTIRFMSTWNSRISLTREWSRKESHQTLISSLSQRTRATEAVALPKLKTTLPSAQVVPPPASRSSISKVSQTTECKIRALLLLKQAVKEITVRQQINNHRSLMCQ